MRTFFAAAAVAGLVCAVNCGSGILPPVYGYADFNEVPPATCHETFAATYEASEFTDQGDRDQLTAAGKAWGDLSKGQISFTITFDPTTPGAFHIHRYFSTDQVVKDYEASQKSEGPDFHVAGWHASNDDVNLVVDRVGGPPWLQVLATHELGHAAHLAWPLCFQSHTDCIHSPDPHAIMAPILPGPGIVDLTPSDLALCRASCLCP